jgi:DNA-binding transcriptional regulator YdaS (Cro superfamily)
MEQITPVSVIDSVLERANGCAALASDLTKRLEQDISRTRVWNWINRDKRFPAEFCPSIEAITGITCEQLRPDVEWSVLRGKKRKAKQSPVSTSLA